MLISGAVAGLVGMPILFGDDLHLRLDVPVRPRASPASRSRCSAATTRSASPIGALLFAYLDEQSNPLQILVGVSPDIVAITQGVIVLTVVISYEVVRRYGVRLEQQGRRALEPWSATPDVEEVPA